MSTNYSPNWKNGKPHYTLETTTTEKVKTEFDRSYHGVEPSPIHVAPYKARWSEMLFLGVGWFLVGVAFTLMLFAAFFFFII